jgi:hypothetical protein
MSSNLNKPLNSYDAVPYEIFMQHVKNHNNPHHVTLNQLGYENVANTIDEVGVKSIQFLNWENDWQDGIADQKAVILGNELVIRHTNMWGYEPTVNEKFLFGDGIERSISDSERSSFVFYLYYIFVPNNPIGLPAKQYPRSSDTNGVWYFVGSQPDRHINYSSYPYYTMVLQNLPPGKSISLYVAVITPEVNYNNDTLQSIKSIYSNLGVPWSV